MNKLKFKIARKEELYTKMTLDKVLALKDTLEYDISYTNPNNVVLFAIDEDE
ncbi:MAG: hypothetical protein IPL95_19785 [Saprospiraceae bacterium]|nr:hypothetical protein [Saprospiraceae bacterium]